MDSLINYGGEIKALGDGRIGGYLVRFSDETSPDLENDFFTKDTDFGIATTLPLYYQHGFDKKFNTKRIGQGDTRKDDVGLWYEAQLALRDEYEKKLYEMVEAGKLGYSSGALGHLVERELVGKSWKVTTWIIGEASLTPTPAEPRNGVYPIKSIVDTEALVEPVLPAVSIKTIRDFEDFLRDAGYSKSQAVAIASGGYKAMSPQRDSESDEEAIKHLAALDADRVALALLTL